MISDARRGHVSPGIYTEEKDVTYSVKSLGITSLGLVGETLYGPAFENIPIKDWTEFVDYFGGTSPEKFKGTGLPKYELPYVAKSYLEKSKNLNVVRVLGLSGYHAGPAYVVKTDDGKVAIILRSKLVYGENSTNFCEPSGDTPVSVVESITIGDYTPVVYTAECKKTPSTENVDAARKFSIAVKTKGYAGYNTDYLYNVSLNSTDSDYIYRVISSSPDTGTTPIYIEAVYENSLDDDAVIAKGDITPISSDTVTYTTNYVLNEDEVVSASSGTWFATYEKVTRIPDDVIPTELEDSAFISGTTLSGNSNDFDKYIVVTTTKPEAVYDDFTEEYRPAQSPWILSEAYASTDSGESATTKVTMKKLFKFITISDGDAANYQVKVSIQNIKPDEGVFDVVVRDFNDTDASPLILERFTKCSMVEGSASYIAYKIGSSDGGYVSKSKYITVEMAEGEDLSNSVPCGFLGYPMPQYKADEKVKVKYNTEFKPEIKAKRQYFGLNEKVIDTDILKYKGKYFYDNAGDADPEYITNGFHMDSILGHSDSANTFVDGVSGYTFDSVSPIKVTYDQFEPRLINASYINHTIYKDVNTRKFTVYCYGGFDGWDVNRTSRTNTNDYKATKYPIEKSTVFTPVNSNGLNLPLNLPSTAITSDYYAYLAGYMVFANPQDVDINLLATPGIDWYNNTLLTEDVIDIIEDSDYRGGDALYIMNSPLMSDGEKFTPSQIDDMFVDTEIDSSYACTYFPWIMYYDNTNKRYLDLPVTKDVVRNMAETDNTSFPWFAPAGMERGNVNCVKANYKTTLNDEDELYENMINPVKSFAKDGVKIWGNKTTYKTDSPLNRINVRRLMIRVKKLVSEAAKNLIFEQYDDTLEKQFRGLVEPILADVKANRGIYDYRVITENTEETRDQHILPAKILIKPTPALEYISISFVVYPESVDFSEN